jgi:hypothetical protein
MTFATNGEHRSVTSDELLRRFAEAGIDWGGELLLSREVARAMLDDAATHGLIVTGATGWYRPASAPDALAEDVGAQVAVPDEILDAPYASEASIAIVRNFIARWLPTRDAYVSVGFLDGGHARHAGGDKAPEQRGESR